MVSYVRVRRIVVTVILIGGIVFLYSTAYGISMGRGSFGNSLGGNTGGIGGEISGSLDSNTTGANFGNFPSKNNLPKRSNFKDSEESNFDNFEEIAPDDFLDITENIQETADDIYRPELAQEVSQYNNMESLNLDQQKSVQNLIDNNQEYINGLDSQIDNLESNFSLVKNLKEDVGIKQTSSELYQRAKAEYNNLEETIDSIKQFKKDVTELKEKIQGVEGEKEVKSEKNELTVVDEEPVANNTQTQTAESSKEEKKEKEKEKGKTIGKNGFYKDTSTTTVGDSGSREGKDGKVAQGTKQKEQTQEKTIAKSEEEISQSLSEKLNYAIESINEKMGSMDMDKLKKKKASLRNEMRELESEMSDNMNQRKLVRYSKLRDELKNVEKEVKQYNNYVKTKKQLKKLRNMARKGKLGKYRKKLNSALNFGNKKKKIDIIDKEAKKIIREVYKKVYKKVVADDIKKGQEGSGKETVKSAGLGFGSSPFIPRDRITPSPSPSKRKTESEQGEGGNNIPPESISRYRGQFYDGKIKGNLPSQKNENPEVEDEEPNLPELNKSGEFSNGGEFSPPGISPLEEESGAVSSSPPSELKDSSRGVPREDNKGNGEVVGYSLPPEEIKAIDENFIRKRTTDNSEEPDFFPPAKKRGSKSVDDESIYGGTKKPKTTVKNVTNKKKEKSTKMEHTEKTVKEEVGRRGRDREKTPGGKKAKVEIVGKVFGIISNWISKDVIGSSTSKIGKSSSKMVSTDALRVVAKMFGMKPSKDAADRQKRQLRKLLEELKGKKGKNPPALVAFAAGYIMGVVESNGENTSFFRTQDPKISKKMLDLARKNEVKKLIKEVAKVSNFSVEEILSFCRVNAKKIAGIFESGKAPGMPFPGMQFSSTIAAELKHSKGIDIKTYKKLTNLLKDDVKKNLKIDQARDIINKRTTDTPVSY